MIFDFIDYHLIRKRRKLSKIVQICCDSKLSFRLAKKTQKNKHKINQIDPQKMCF